MTELARKRPEFRNINALTDLPSYNLPAAGWVSILHRISGALMFVLMPFIIWMFDNSITSEFSYAKFTAIFTVGCGFLPGWMMKLAALALVVADAELRFLWLGLATAVLIAVVVVFRRQMQQEAG
jgi:succinate dehydrogenase / fumarate reductase cytochrome b subunit